MIVTGDELLRARIADRNGAYLSGWLDGRGVAVDTVTIMGDRLAGIRDAVAAALADGIDLICTTGGLGPTHDDLTMAAVAEATGRELRVDAAALTMVEARSRGIRVGEETAARTRAKQASLPEGALVIPPAGTAPGCVLIHGATVIVVLPGPPWELRRMWQAATADAPALVDVLERAEAAPERVLRVHATSESLIVDLLERPDAPDLSALELGICARDAELELTVRGDRAVADALVGHLRAGVGEALYSVDGRTVDVIVAEALGNRKETLAVAESCTGGALGARLTAPGGASAYMLGGVVSYSNAVKRDVLGVAEDILERHGAVSSECAAAMAEGVRSLLGSTWALSITGIAGPGGGGPGKPVGLVYLGRSGLDGTVTTENHFRGDREEVRRRSIAAAMHLLRAGLRSS